MISPTGARASIKAAPIWPDENGGFFHAVADEMLKQGFARDEIGKIGGGNFCRIFANVTAGHA
jgi:membrane dipeptidase